MVVGEAGCGEDLVAARAAGGEVRRKGGWRVDEVRVSGAVVAGKGGTGSGREATCKTVDVGDCVVGVAVAGMIREASDGGVGELAVAAQGKAVVAQES